MTGALALLAALVGFAPEAAATEVGTERNLGLGLTVGEPTGLTGKYYVSGPTHAIEAAVATNLWGFGDDRLTAYATYMNHPGIIASGTLIQMPWHVGLGGQFWSSDLGDDEADAAFGVRIPVGLDLNFQDIPLQISGDLAAVAPVVPELVVGLDLNLAVRYYF